MTPENIIQLISLLLGGRRIIKKKLITERKTKAQMENTAQAIAEWQKIVERSHQDLKEAKERAKELQDLYLVQFDINTKLRKELDEKNTKIAVLSLLRCRKLKCIDREPPYGSEVEKEAANEQ